MTSLSHSSGQDGGRVPVLLLKTKSTPADAYEELLAAPRDDGLKFEPIFVPVLQHRFEDGGMDKIGALLGQKRIGNALEAAYGGLIFTSQRAVEAFSKLVEDGRQAGEETWPHLQHIPIYSVGPATTRALKAIPQEPPLNIFGDHTGNGEALAHFMLEHYNDWYSNRSIKPSMLFMVGEQRRDIIPKTLMDQDLPSDRRIEVDETIVYGTGVMESFAVDFAQVLERTAGRPNRWVVVFSPTGCDSMLRGLGMLDDDTGKVSDSSRNTLTSIATIGPTTQKYLQTTFGYEPDVCSERPSPEGVLQGIISFSRQEK